jgi:hypothetical protein
MKYTGFARNFPAEIENMNTDCCFNHSWIELRDKFWKVKYFLH